MDLFTLYPIQNVMMFLWDSKVWGFSVVYASPLGDPFWV